MPGEPNSRRADWKSDGVDPVLLQVEQQTLFTHLAAQLEHGKPGKVTAVRSAGLHAGAWEAAADFDAPLPDEFWLGREA